MRHKQQQAAVNNNKTRRSAMVQLCSTHSVMLNTQYKARTFNHTYVDMRCVAVGYRFLEAVSTLNCGLSTAACGTTLRWPLGCQTHAASLAVRTRHWACFGGLSRTAQNPRPAWHAQHTTAQQVLTKHVCMHASMGRLRQALMRGAGWSVRGPCACVHEDVAMR